MESLTLEDIIKKEVNKWQNRVYYPDEKFKENTTANLEELHNYIMSNGFHIICSETEGCVYKIGRFIIEHGTSNNKITFEDGDLFGAYLDINTKYESQSRLLFDRLLNNIKPKVKDKLLFIPCLNNSWDKNSVQYFINEMKIAGAIAIVFYSNKDYADTFGEILCKETNINVLQFPKIQFEKSKKIAVNDNY